MDPICRSATSSRRRKRCARSSGSRASWRFAKEISYLDAHCRAFIARSPFVLIATSGAS